MLARAEVRTSKYLLHNPGIQSTMLILITSLLVAFASPNTQNLVKYIVSHSYNKKKQCNTHIVSGIPPITTQHATRLPYSILSEPEI